VFALTQVTGFLANHLTWAGTIQGAALLAVLWWAWGGYAWLTNAVPAEEVIPARLVILTAMAFMLVASLAVPDAFGTYGVLFGLSYFAVRLLQVLLYALATGGTPETRRTILRLSTGFLLAPALLIVAGFLDGFAQGALWVFALAIDYGVALVGGVSGFRVHAGHFVERHGLVIIIALGESIVAIGVGVSGLTIGPGVIVATILGVALAAGLWWAYFDLVMLAAERRLSRAKGEVRDEASARLLQLPSPADGGRDNLRRPGHQAKPGPRRGAFGDDPGRRVVRRRRPLSPRAQRAQVARRRQRERTPVGGDRPLLRARPRGGICTFPRHPRDPGGTAVRARRVRDGALSGVQAWAPCALEAASCGFSARVYTRRILRPLRLSVGPRSWPKEEAG
jgi:hypothetical protein